MVNKETVLKLYKEGLTLNRIGDMVGVSDARIFQIVKQYCPEEVLKRPGTRESIKVVHNSKSELYIIEKLKSMGFNVIPQTYNAPFDLLVNGRKVEVKHIKKPLKPYPSAPNSYYKFSTLYNLVPVDFYILICGKLKEARHYIIPSNRVSGSFTVSLIPRQLRSLLKDLQYKENWSVLA